MGHGVGLMSLLVVHEAHMPVYYTRDPDFFAGGQVGPPVVEQEVLADLKKVERLAKPQRRSFRGE